MVQGIGMSDDAAGTGMGGGVGVSHGESALAEWGNTVMTNADAKIVAAVASENFLRLSDIVCSPCQAAFLPLSSGC
jgi:hypothetical protein